MTYSNEQDWWQRWEFSFLALTLWREARGESFETKVAVVHSIMNRVDNPGWWGNTITGVLKKKWQYSSLTDPKDPQLTLYPGTDDESFEECLKAVAGVQEGLFKNPFTGADSYYDDSLQGDRRPKWAKEHPECYVGKSGRLNFYNLEADMEGPP